MPISLEIFNELGIFLLIGAIIAFGLWLYLYTINYNDWFKGLLKKRALKRSVKIMNKDKSHFATRLNHLEANLSSYPPKRVISELDFIMRSFFIKTFNLNAKYSQTFSDIISELRKRAVSPDLIEHISPFFKKMALIKYDERFTPKGAELADLILTAKKVMDEATFVKQEQDKREAYY